MNKQLKKDIKRMVKFEQNAINNHLKQWDKLAKIEGLWQMILTKSS